jgi:hypothetical protein
MHEASGHERRPDGWFAGDSKQSVKAGVSERSFICDECPRTFLRRQDLRRHLVAQHGAGGGDGKKILLCVGCKVFTIACLLYFREASVGVMHCIVILRPGGARQGECKQ